MTVLPEHAAKSTAQEPTEPRPLEQDHVEHDLEGSERRRASAELGALMIAYQAGELAAFEGLYHKLQPALRRYLLSLTLRAQHAEDLLQETFLQIHRSRHTYLPKRPVEPWAFGIARNVYLMDRRSGLRRQRHEAEPTDDLPELPTPARIDDIAHRDQLRRAIAELSPERREPLLLHHVWGFSFKEIGGILGIREGAAKVRAHRALERLRAQLRRPA